MGSHEVPKQKKTLGPNQDHRIAKITRLKRRPKFYARKRNILNMYHKADVKAYLNDNVLITFRATVCLFSSKHDGTAVKIMQKNYAQIMQNFVEK